MCGANTLSKNAETKRQLDKRMGWISYWSTSSKIRATSIACSQNHNKNLP